jgi:hypothetical protein
MQFYGVFVILGFRMILGFQNSWPGTSPLVLDLLLEPPPHVLLLLPPGEVLQGGQDLALRHLPRDGQSAKARKLCGAQKNSSYINQGYKLRVVKRPSPERESQDVTGRQKPKVWICASLALCHFLGRRHPEGRASPAFGQSDVPTWVHLSLGF